MVCKSCGAANTAAAAHAAARKAHDEFAVPRAMELAKEVATLARRVYGAVDVRCDRELGDVPATRPLLRAYAAGDGSVCALLVAAPAPSSGAAVSERSPSSVVLPGS